MPGWGSVKQSFRFPKGLAWAWSKLKEIWTQPGPLLWVELFRLVLVAAVMCQNYVNSEVRGFSILLATLLQLDDSLTKVILVTFPKPPKGIPKFSLIYLDIP